MEAPEKLYLHPTAKGNVGASWLTFPLANEDIEYIRTEAFIEKALKFLDENFFFNNLHYSIESGVFYSKEEMFEDFKKYIEE